MNTGDTDVTGAVLHVLRGLPRAGKSTTCRRIQDIYGNVPIVSKDSIRLALHGQPFLEALEPEVHQIAKVMLKALLYSGHRQVIIDECHTRDAYVRAIADEHPTCIIKEWVIPTPPDICIQRAIDCGQDYLLPVITSMAAQAEFGFSAE